jgi:ABC-2 type transport system ATP-binding protein
MKQRLALAQALLADPEILVLDEPANGLDPRGIIENRELLTRLAAEKGVTILVSSHILSELSRLVTRCCILSRGEVVKVASGDELSAAGLEAYFLDAGPAAEEAP